MLALAILGPLFWCFGPALLTDRGFAFRDAAHFYYPLFDWTTRQWASGQIPLWNPQENCGLPLLADGTSSVFYPGKLVFALPLSYAWNFKLYTSLHVLLAAGAAFVLARRWNASPCAAGLAAVTYAFGGNVLFQYCNTVYLVGAAWLPLALAAADRMLVGRSWRGGLLLGAVLAVMVLGGDPQMAYHAGLLAAIYAWLLWRSERPFFRSSQPRSTDGDKSPRGTAVAAPRGSGPMRNRLVLLGLAATAAFALCAIQVIPSSEWSRRSGRAAYRSPRSVYEIPAYLARSDVERERSSIPQGLFGTPERGMHHEHIYHFSVSPWRLIELAWPNCTGQMFPVHRRWASAVPAEGRIWTPSLYLGLIPLLLGLSAWRVRGGPPAMRWLSWASLLATLASFGGYGLGWLLYEFRHSVFGVGGDPAIGWPVGGLYWMAVVLLPGYVYFRYPAKLLVIAALGISQLAAFALDRLGECEPVRLRRWTLGFVLVSLALYLASWSLESVWNDWTRHVRPDGVYGPFDAVGSLVGLRASLLHAVLLGAVFWSMSSEAGRHSPRWLAPALLLVTAADVSISNGWMVLTAPQRDWTEPSTVADRMAANELEKGDGQPFRVFRGSRRHWHPPEWTLRSSTERHRESFRWDRQTQYPKYHLENGLAIVEAFGSAASYDYLAVLGAARRYGWQRPDSVAEPSPVVLDLLGVRYLIFPADAPYPAATRLPLADDRPPVPNTSLWYNPNAYPRAWMVREIVTVPPLRRPGPDQIARRTRQVFFPGDTPYDLRRTAVVESDTKPPLPSQPPSPEAVADERCYVVQEDPQQIVIQAELQQPGLLVVSDLYYPGWSAEVSTDQGRPLRVPIYRTNRIMRGVALPAGTHRITFVYRPPLFYAGAAISILAWMAVGCALVRRRHAWA